MRNLFFLLVSVSLLFIGCKPKDTQPPLIILNGDNPMTVTLGSWWEDPGAIVEDNVDGSMVGKLTITHNIDINGPANGEGTTKLSGTYTVTYTAKDEADNEATTTRTVYVKSSADKYVTKYYQYVDPTNNDIVQKDTITVDLAADARVNNKIYFPKLGSKLNQTYPNTIRVYGNIIGASHDSINIPVQYFSFWEGTVRYLYTVSSVPSQCYIFDTIDPDIRLKYYLNKYVYHPTLGTVSWHDSLWKVYKNDIVFERYERY